MVFGFLFQVSHLFDQIAAEHESLTAQTARVEQWATLASKHSDRLTALSREVAQLEASQGVLTEAQSLAAQNLVEQVDAHMDSGIDAQLEQMTQRVNGLNKMVSSGLNIAQKVMDKYGDKAASVIGKATSIAGKVSMAAGS